MITKKTGLIALLTCVATSGVWAGDLTSYAVGDVLVCFRKGGNDMVVDAGPVATLTNAAVNQRIDITQYTGDQLAEVGTNAVNWSAFTWASDKTLFVTKPRVLVNSQTTPWPDASTPNQTATINRMVTIPPGALDQYNLLVYPVSTATAVVEEDSSGGNPNYPNGVSYHDALAGAYGGNFNGSFAGNPENTTANNFTAAGMVVRSDFYQMTSTSTFGLGKWLGYFEFNTNGAMAYVAYPTATPVIKSISRSGTTTTIKYTAGIYGTYTLRGTNSLTSEALKTSWPAITTLASGDNAIHTMTDTTSDDSRFYVITAQ